MQCVGVRLLTKANLLQGLPSNMHYIILTTQRRVDAPRVYLRPLQTRASPRIENKIDLTRHRPVFFSTPAVWKAQQPLILKRRTKIVISFVQHAHIHVHWNKYKINCTSNGVDVRRRSWVHLCSTITTFIVHSLCASTVINQSAQNA